MTDNRKFMQLFPLFIVVCSSVGADFVKFTDETDFLDGCEMF